MDKELEHVEQEMCFMRSFLEEKQGKATKSILSRRE
jgi:hypothetical protein